MPLSENPTGGRADCRISSQAAGTTVKTITTPSPIQAGFTIIEVVIAMTVMVGALVLTVGQHANVVSMQRRTQEASAVDRIIQSLVNRVNSVTWSHLGTSRAPWSIGRYETLDATDSFHVMIGTSESVGRDPMTFNVANGANDQFDDLVLLGLTSSLDGPSDLRIYLEYWRAMDYVDPTGVQQEGLLDEEVDNSGEFRAMAYNDPMRKELGLRSTFALTGWDPSDISEGNSPGLRSSVIDPTHPLLIRIVAVWEDGDPDPTRFAPRQRREIFTARAP